MKSMIYVAFNIDRNNVDNCYIVYLNDPDPSHSEPYSSL